MAALFRFVAFLTLAKTYAWENDIEPGQNSISGMSVKDLVAQADILMQSALAAHASGNTVMSKTLMAEANRRIELANSFNALHIDAAAEDTVAAGVRFRMSTMMISACAFASLAVLAIIAQYAIKHVRGSCPNSSDTDLGSKPDFEPLLEVGA